MPGLRILPSRRVFGADPLRRSRSEKLHSRNGRLRRRVLRLRQRRLARHFRALSGTRLEGDPPDATNRLYQEQSRRHVHGRHRKGRAAPHRMGIGGHRRRLQQRRLRRPLHHLLGPECALPQQRRRHVHRCHGEGRAAAGRKPRGARAARASTTTATVSWICSWPITSSSIRQRSPSRARTRTATGRAFR